MSFLKTLLVAPSEIFINPCNHSLAELAIINCLVSHQVGQTHETHDSSLAAFGIF